MRVLLSAVVSAVSDLVGRHGAEHRGLETGSHLLHTPPPLHRPCQLQVSIQLLLCYAVCLCWNCVCDRVFAM